MNSRTEDKLKDISGMSKAVNELLHQAWERGYKYGLQKDYGLAIKALEVVDKIKKAYSANKEIDEIDDAMCFANATYDILCEAYGSDTDCESWVKDIE